MSLTKEQRSVFQDKFLAMIHEWGGDWAHAFEFKDPEIVYDLLWRTLDIIDPTENQGNP